MPEPLVPTSATRSPGVSAKSTLRITVGPSYENERSWAARMTGPVAAWWVAGGAIDGASSSSGSHAPAATSRERDRASTSAGRPKSIGRPSGPSASTRSAMGHATSTRCSTMTMVTARDGRSAARRAANARAAGGSRLAVGSSRTRIPGRGASAPASASRCCWPPESFVVRRRSSPPRPTSTSASGTRASIASRGQPRLSSPNATSSSTRSITIWLSGSWNTSPTRAATSAPGAVTGSIPSTVSRPRHSPANSRGTRPASASASVLLPEPDGPTTSRHSPGSTSNETSANAGSRRLANRKPMPSARIAPRPARGGLSRQLGTPPARRPGAGPWSGRRTRPRR